MVLWGARRARGASARRGRVSKAASWAGEEADDLISFAGTKMRGATVEIV